jgi:hypothetical protein
MAGFRIMHATQTMPNPQQYNQAHMDQSEAARNKGKYSGVAPDSLSGIESNVKNIGAGLQAGAHSEDPKLTWLNQQVQNLMTEVKDPHNPMAHIQDNVVNDIFNGSPTWKPAFGAYMTSLSNRYDQLTQKALLNRERILPEDVDNVNYLRAGKPLFDPSDPYNTHPSPRGPVQSEVDRRTQGGAAAQASPSPSASPSPTASPSPYVSPTPRPRPSPSPQPGANTSATPVYNDPAHPPQTSLTVVRTPQDWNRAGSGTKVMAWDDKRKVWRQYIK